jgi:hypothetical protein
MGASAFLGRLRIACPVGFKVDACQHSPLWIEELLTRGIAYALPKRGIDG